MKLYPILFEKIRSKDNFDIREFKALKTIPEVRRYVREHELQKLGVGNSRIVYALSSRFALKIALFNQGLEQNEAEVKLSKTPGVEDVIAKVHSYDPEYKWIIADLVRPLNWLHKPKEAKDFESKTGVSSQEFTNLLRHSSDKQFPDRSYGDNPKDDKDPWDNYPDNKFLKGLRKLIDSGVSAPDLGRLEQYGVTPDGRVVILDYGGTVSVLTKPPTTESNA
jgi:hypothetical protein